jgi:vitamin B12 transporter
MRHALLVVATLLLAAGGHQGVAAQQPPKIPTYVLDPIVVTATRTATAAARTGASVTVVTGEQLRERGATTLLEALAGLPGVVIARSGPAAGTATLMLRGAKGEHLLVLIDGVAANDPMSPGGGFDWNTLTAEGIERIEIVRGPQSTLYGSEAMAGVVQIITRRPGAGPPRLSLSLETGSYQSVNGTAGLTGEAAGTGYRLELGGHRLGGVSSAADPTAGSPEPDAWSTWSGSLRLERPLAAGRLMGTLRGSRSRFDLDDFGGPYGDDPNSRSRKTDLFGSLVWQGPVAGGWEQRLLLGGGRTFRWNNDPPDDSDPSSSEGAWRGRVLTAEWDHDLMLGSHRLAAGLAWERTSGRSRSTYESGTDLFIDLVPERAQSAAAVYLQDQITVGGADLVLGGRVDRYTDYGTRPTGRAALTLPLGPVRLRGSCGTGFKAPTLYQRFHPEYGNAALAAERTRAGEVGLALRLARGEVALTRYYQLSRGLIDFVTDPETWVSRYENRGQVRLTGWEASARLALSARLGAEASWTRLKAREAESDLALIRRPAHTWLLGLEAEPAPGWHGGLRLRGVGRREDLDFSAWPAERVTLAAVTLLEGELTRRFNPGLAIRLRGENLTGAAPEWVWGYGSPGRAIYMAILLGGGT